MDNTADLSLLLAGRTPVVFVETDEEQRFLDLLEAVVDGRQLWTWSSTTGLARLHGDPMYATTNPHQALDCTREIDTPAVFVFADAHHALRDPSLVRRLKEAAQDMKEGQAYIFTAPAHDLPPELSAIARLWRLKPPDPSELEALITRTLGDLRSRGFAVSFDEDSVTAMVEALKGLTTLQAERLVQEAAIDGDLGGDDLPELRSAKAELLAGNGILELVEADSGALSSVGGLDSLKDWLHLRQRAKDSDAARLGLDAPRGILLTGVPGCGKSFVAKCLARTWEQPLVLLDPGRLYSKYLGESEQRLARALDAVDAVAPAVLWIDEIEKGFAAGGEDGGVSRRLLGTFLRWMQDRPDGIFVVATANDVRSLPPEFLRKGRFDEIFFVDLPDRDARGAILSLHLSLRGQDPKSFDLSKLAEMSAGFSGAEIEAAVVGSAYRALAAGRRPDTELVAEELASTVPLSVSRTEDITRLREWARRRAVAA